MLFRRPAPTPSFDAMVRTHAPTLVTATYQGLLHREPDVVGLQNNTELLRASGDLPALMRTFIESQEFLGTLDARRQAHIEAAGPQLPKPEKKIAILTNCQGHNLARSIQALTSRQAPSFQFVPARDVVDPRRHLERLRRTVAEHDVVIVQPRYYAALQALGEISLEKIMVVPSITFLAFHPDICGVRIHGGLEEVLGPLGRYQSAIAFYAWRAGLSARQALDYYCDAAYEELRYYDYWDRSTRLLLEHGENCGMPMDRALQSWHAQGCFMHSPNHPKLFVLADLARMILDKLEVPYLPINPQEVFWDYLADLAICPVYPEIARRIGVKGSLLFKAESLGLGGKAPITSFDLQEFVERSFASFQQYSTRFEMTCARAYSPRYEALFGPDRQWQRAQPLPALPRTGSRHHPYAHLPAQQFWKQAVGNQSMADIDPVTDGDFSITPQSRIATAGSCFAQHIARALRQRGYQPLLTEAPPLELDRDEATRRNYGVYTARFGNIYTARQLLQLLQRAYGDFTPQEDIWWRADGRCVDAFRPEIEPDGFVDVATLHAARDTHLAAVRTMFETLDTFIFTLGLTEAWRSTLDGAVFPLAPGVVAGEMDEQRHAFVNFDVTEVVADLEAFQARLCAINPAARLLFTVSPVPLAATYEPRHVLTANSYSKSVLRVAAEQLCQRHAHCHYFPSYEIITGNHARGIYFDSDLRTVTPAGVAHVMRLFFAHCAPDQVVPQPDDELMQEARENDRLVCEEDRLGFAGDDPKP